MGVTYVKRVSIFFSIVALIAGMVGCSGGGGGVIKYGLTMAASPAGQGTATDLTNASPYAAGSGVGIKAVAAAGYRFARWTAPAGGFADSIAAQTTFTMPAQGVTVMASFEHIPMVAADYYHTVGLKADGTVVAVGQNSEGQCNVTGWTNIVQVTAGYEYTVGLRADGTVVAVGGDNYYGQCNVTGWTDIVQVSAGMWHTVGLRADGTVVALGDNYWGQCNVAHWTRITQVAAGYEYTVGLTPYDTVVAVGDNSYGQCNVAGWYLN